MSLNGYIEITATLHEESGKEVAVQHPLLDASGSVRIGVEGFENLEEAYHEIVASLFSELRKCMRPVGNLSRKIGVVEAAAEPFDYR